MALVHKVLTGATVAGTISPVVFTQHRVDENMAGAIQWNQVGNYNLHFEARMEGPANATTGWFLVFNLRESVGSDAQGMNFNTGKLYPLMRVRCATLAGGAVVSAWIME